MPWHFVPGPRLAAHSGLTKQALGWKDWVYSDGQESRRISEMPVTSVTKQESPIYVKLPEIRMLHFTLDFFLNPIV